jgi:activator of HSP90 ATPase
MNRRLEVSRQVQSLSRRELIAGSAIALGGLLVGEAHSQAAKKPGEESSSARTSLHYEEDLKARPERVYGVLLGAKDFSALTGIAAEIDANSGGAFSLFGGQVVGRNVDLVPNQRIVQAWRLTHWETGVYSIVKFELRGRGAETTMLLDHTGFPNGDADSLDAGWHLHYLSTLSKYFA